MGRSDSGSDACPVGTEDCRDDEQPEHPATISSFYLDTFEVTVGRFRRFVEVYTGEIPAGAGEHPLIGNSGWESEWNAELPALRAGLEEALDCEDHRTVAFPTWTEKPGPNEMRPINCVTWYEAFAFCAWDQGRLPTEAEWERAAAGGDENRLYPWGDGPPTLSHTSYSMAYDGIAARSSMEDLPVAGSTPQGKGLWGHQDLAGGLLELVFDRYDGDWYSRGACDDCANQSSGDRRARRGSGFNHNPRSQRAANRFQGEAPQTRRFYVGIRCARQQ
jgi:formylglycine-generating enzyme required for sulfatase activity